jgi:hypothetical protein
MADVSRRTTLAGLAALFLISILPIACEVGNTGTSDSARAPEGKVGTTAAAEVTLRIEGMT